MIVTTYTCDKCEHSQEDPKQMWDMGITVSPKKPPISYSYSKNPVKKALWCRGCVEKLGLLPSTKEDSPAPTKPPTFEDIIREIVQEEMENSQ